MYATLNIRLCKLPSPKRDKSTGCSFTHNGQLQSVNLITCNTQCALERYLRLSPGNQTFSVESTDQKRRVGGTKQKFQADRQKLEFAQTDTSILPAVRQTNHACMQASYCSSCSTCTSVLSVRYYNSQPQLRVYIIIISYRLYDNERINYQTI